MIKKTHLLAFVTVVMLLSSCAKRIAVPYSTVEKIVKVTPGMTTSDVSSTLGIPPYDVYHMAGDGSTVLIFNYKLKQRKNTGCGALERMGFADPFYSKEENLAVGSSYYVEESKVYILFQNGKVTSLVTDAGREDSEDLLIQNNTIQFISKSNRHSFNYYNYEKLELGQQLIRLDSKGNIVKNKGGLFGGSSTGPAKKKKGCMSKGCFGK
ncbi:MAG: hypothetical protein U0V03_05090 [Bacteroidia bacterium]|jgi:hypothetical protein